MILLLAQPRSARPHTLLLLLLLLITTRPHLSRLSSSIAFESTKSLCFAYLECLGSLAYMDSHSLSNATSSKVALRGLP